eukprot:4370629-Ditylum_brightwellii.AAC.1
MSSYDEDSIRVVHDMLEQVPRGLWYNVFNDGSDDADSLSAALSVSTDKLMSCLTRSGLSGKI